MRMDCSWIFGVYPEEGVLESLEKRLEEVLDGL